MFDAAVQFRSGEFTSAARNMDDAPIMSDINKHNTGCFALFASHFARDFLILTARARL